MRSNWYYVVLYGFSERILRFQFFICNPPIFPGGSFIHKRKIYCTPDVVQFDFYWNLKIPSKNENWGFWSFNLGLTIRHFFLLLNFIPEVKLISIPDGVRFIFSTLFVFNERKFEISVLFCRFFLPFTITLRRKVFYQSRWDPTDFFVICFGDRKLSCQFWILITFHFLCFSITDGV